MAAVGKVERCARDRVIKGDGIVLAAVLNAAQVELGIAAEVSQQGEDELLRAGNGFRQRGLAGCGGVDIIKGTGLCAVALINGGAVGL